MTSLKPVGRWAGQDDDFNAPVADAIYASLMAMDPDEAQVAGAMLVGATVHSELMLHGAAISKALHAVATRRSELLKGQLARTAITKSRNGQDATGEFAALIQLAKAVGTTDPFTGENSRSDRVRRATEQLHDLQNGRFRQESISIDHAGSQAIPEKLATRWGIPPSASVGELTADEKAQFQNAYHQVAALIGPYQRLPQGSAFVHLLRADGKKRLLDVPHGDGKLAGSLFDPREAAGGPVTGAMVSRLPTPDAPGATFDVLRAFGAQPHQAAVGAGQLERGLLSPTDVQAFGDKWNERQVDDQFNPSQRGFRRLLAGVGLLNNALGPSAPPQAKMALQVAQHIGTFGPVAQKVIAPTADRMAYRYRGTERRPDSMLLRAFDADGAKAAELTGESGKQHAVQDAERQRDLKFGHVQSLFDEDYRRASAEWERAKTAHRAGRIDRAEYQARAAKASSDIAAAQARRKRGDAKAMADFKVAAAEAKTAMRGSAGVRRQAQDNIVMTGYTPKDTGEWQPGQVLTYFRRRVPKPELSDLQLKSGVVPPSEGVIIDADGNLAHQVVGYGDDHYLPFNLKNLRRLRGGEYIRTRTYGGPTTEDIYTGLMAGARRLTVVSNAGVFTVTFDPSFHGGRRYNDKAMRMTGRYGYLLDAVKAGRVTPRDIVPSRMEEIRDAARRRFPVDETQRGLYVKQLEAEQRRTGQLSERQRWETATTWLSEAAIKQGTRTGAEQTPEQLTGEVADKLATQAMREDEQAADQDLQTKTAAWEAVYPEGAAHTEEDWLQRERYAAQWEAEHPGGEPVKRWPRPVPAPVRRATMSYETARAAAVKVLNDKNPYERAQVVAQQLGVTDSLERAMKDAAQQNKESGREMRLNGDGYFNALKALQEQFPYYLLEPVYRPWDQTGTHEDTGYVRPGLNRPSQAMAGYFDGGSGSGAPVAADTIRGQSPILNRPAERAAAAAPTGTPTGSTPAAPAAAAARATIPSTPAERAQARVAVDRKVLEHLLAQTTFPPESMIGKQDVSGKDIRGLLASAASPPPELIPLYGKDDSGLPVTPQAVLARFDADPAAGHKMVADALGWILSNNRVIPIPDGMETEFRQGVIGAAAPPREPNSAKGMLAEPDAHYAWPTQMGPAYEAKSPLSAEELRTAYNNDAKVSSLIERDMLPQDPDAPDFKKNADDLQARLTKDYNAYAAWQQQTGGVANLAAPIDHKATLNDIVGLALAYTLRRNHAAALAREEQEQTQAQDPATPGAPAAAGGDIGMATTINDVKQLVYGGDPVAFAAMTPEQATAYAETLKNVAAALGNQLPPQAHEVGGAGPRSITDRDTADALAIVDMRGAGMSQSEIDTWIRMRDYMRDQNVSEQQIRETAQERVKNYK